MCVWELRIKKNKKQKLNLNLNMTVHMKKDGRREEGLALFSLIFFSFDIKSTWWENRSMYNTCSATLTLSSVKQDFWEKLPPCSSEGWILPLCPATSQGDGPLEGKYIILRHHMRFFLPALSNIIGYINISSKCILSFLWLVGFHRRKASLCLRY